MNEASAETASGQSRSERKSAILWIVGGVVAIAVLSVTATFVPAALKRLVIFHLVFGAACGYVLAWLAEELSLPLRGWMMPFVALLTVAGAVQMAHLSYRQFHAARQELARERSKDVAALKMMQSLAEQDEDLDLKAFAKRFSEKLEARKDQILDELTVIQGNAADIGGYYHAPADKVCAVMQPSETLNSILAEFAEAAE